ncbi:MAG TPA: S8/S53 family peptidase [Solirubrobacteraceae bacterium]
MFDPESGHIRVLLEVIPSESLLAAIDEDTSLAGNPNAAQALSGAGMSVDPAWPALSLGPDRPTIGSTLADRPRFESIRGTLNKVGETVNKVGETLPMEFRIPTWEAPERRTVLFRAGLPPGDAATKALAVAAEQTRVVGVYSDPQVALASRRIKDPAYGTADDVAERMGVARLHESGLNGEGVPVVVVDSGISLDYLRDRGREHELDPVLSCTTKGSPHAPGQFPAGHGTLAAFQIGIAAPQATLVDQGVLTDRTPTDGEPLIQAWLSDIEPGYVELHRYLSALDKPSRRLVVSNSWAMIRPDWDFEIEHVQNFSDNPQHPFNRMVCELTELGADFLFSAGNCGELDPVGRCGFKTQPICGANSLEEVITVGAVAIDGTRLGYSSQGPGRIVVEKPDLCGYSHYQGSGIGSPPVDWGTSTACPGVAGVIAALRTRYSSDELSPYDLKRVVLESARRPSGAGHSPDTGYGVIDAAALLDRLP